MAGEEFPELGDSQRRSLVLVDGFVALVAAICGALTASHWLVVDGKVVRGYNLSAGVGVAVVASVGIVIALVAAFSNGRSGWRWLAAGEVGAAGVAIALTIIGLAKAPSSTAVWRDRGGGYAALGVAVGWLVLAMVQLVLSFRRRVKRVAIPPYRQLSTVAERVTEATTTSSSSAGSTSQGANMPAQPTLAVNPPSPVLGVRPARPRRPAVDSLVAIFWIAAILSIIGAIVLGVSTSREFHLTTDAFGSPTTTTTHNGSIVFAWIVAGILSAALWATLGVGLRLLAEIADNTHATASVKPGFVADTVTPPATAGSGL